MAVRPAKFYLQEAGYKYIHGKRGIIARAELQAQRAKPQATENYFQDLQMNGVSPVGFQNCLGLLAPFFFYPVSPSTGEEMSIMLCLSHHYILGTNYLFSSFTGPQKKNFSPRWIIPRVSPIPDLDNKDDETEGHPGGTVG